MANEQQHAAHIIEYAGGPENIRLVTHCMTRLRVFVKNDSFVDLNKLRQLDGVIGIYADEAIHLVVGPGHAVRWAVAVQRELEMKQIQSSTEETKAPVRRLLRKIGNIYIPLIPGVVASGLLTGAANFAKSSGVDPDLMWMQLLLFLGSGFFSYIGILVGWNTAREFRGTPVLGAIGAMFIVHPNLSSLTIFSEPVVPGQGGFFGIMLAAWLMVVCERLVRRVVPSSVDVLVTPLMTILTVGTLTLFLVQPAAGWLSHMVTGTITAMLNTWDFMAGALLAGFYLPVVLVGLHHGLTPLHMELIQVYGYTSLLPVLAMAGAGQVGAALAVYVKTRQEQLRSVIKAALPAGLLGIGEPLLYGVTLPLGRPFITACLGGAAGGAFQAGFHTAASGIGVSGLSLTPLIVHNQYGFYIIGILAAYGAGFLFTYAFGFQDDLAVGTLKNEE